MKKSLLFCLLALSPLLSAQILVLPFRMDAPGRPEINWLGRALSHALTLDCEALGLSVVSADDTDRLLSESKIPFPFTLSKATALRLARRCGARQVIWGSIRPDDPEGNRISIHGQILHLTPYRQTYLTVLKGRVRHADRIMLQARRFCREALFRPGPPEELPASSRTLQTWELLIKGMLSTDPARCGLLLNQARNQEPQADDILQALALHFWRQDRAHRILELLSEHRKSALPPAPRLAFLEAMALTLQGREQAVSLWEPLVKQHILLPWSATNMALVLSREGRAEEALDVLDLAEQAQSTPRLIQADRLYLDLCRLTQNNPRALRRLRQALPHALQDERLLGHLSLILAANPRREELFSVFQELIPELPDHVDLIDPRDRPLADPFTGPLNLPLFPPPPESAPVADDDESPEQALERLTQALEVDPLNPALLRQRQNCYQALKRETEAIRDGLAAALLESAEGDPDPKTEGSQQEP